jgi:hypothetical protein
VVLKAAKVSLAIGLAAPTQSRALPTAPPPFCSRQPFSFPVAAAHAAMGGLA